MPVRVTNRRLPPPTVREISRCVLRDVYSVAFDHFRGIESRREARRGTVAQFQSDAAHLRTRQWMSLDEVERLKFRGVTLHNLVTGESHRVCMLVAASSFFDLYAAARVVLGLPARSSKLSLMLVYMRGRSDSFSFMEHIPVHRHRLGFPQLRSSTLGFYIQD